MEQSIVNSIVSECVQIIKSIKRKKSSFPKVFAKSDPYELVLKCSTPEEIVNYVNERHKKVSTKTIYGYLYESIALSIVKIVYRAYKSAEVCTDLEWVDELNKKHYRGWKSSPFWGNSDQTKACIKKLEELIENPDFGSFLICTSYGKTSIKRKKGKRTYEQKSGQDAWETISGDAEMYNKVMESLLLHKDSIEQTMKDIYISEDKRSITWIEKNFLNEDKTINFKKINEYISGKNKVRVTKW
jgi:hypothetical protein